MRVQKKYLRQNGRCVPIWTIVDASGKVLKISKKPLDKFGKVCYNKDTKLRKGIDTNGN